MEIDLKCGPESGAPFRVDARGIKCPLPVLKTRKALLSLPAGQVLEVLCTDPVSVVDIPNLVREMDFVLLETLENRGEFRFLIGGKDPRG